MTRVGIIGTGWGRMHLGGFRRAGAEVVALCGRSPERTQAVAKREGVPLATSDVKALFAACDLVVVASPDRLHREHVLGAIAAGRHVLCEKPLGFTAAEADEVVAAAKRAGVCAAVSFPYRMLPPFLTLQRWVREVRGLEVVVRNGFLAAMTGESGDFGGVSHAIDTALWLTRARPEQVTARVVGRALQLTIVQAPGPAEAQRKRGEGSGVLISIAHRPSVEPGLWGSWSLWGEEWEAGISAGYRPGVGGWLIDPPRGCIAERAEGTQGPPAREWRDLSPGVAPAPGRLEPWAQAHVDGARAMLAAIGGGARGELATFEDGARVQRVLEALRA